MSDILNQKTRSFFDEVDLFKQTAKKMTEINKALFPEIKKISSFNNKVYYGETVRGMTHVSPILQKTLANANSREIIAAYYIDAEKVNKEKKNLISDVDTDDEFIEFISKEVFNDKNNNGINDGNEYSFVLKIFISKNGNKITESYNASKVAGDELLLFIEHGDDLFSTKKMYAKAGKNVQDYIDKNNLYTKLKNYLSNTDETSAETSLEISPLTIDQLKELLEKGSLQTTYDFIKSIIVALQRVVSFPSSLLGKVLIEIGNLVNYLTISEKFWDTSSEDYEIKAPVIDIKFLEEITQSIQKTNIDVETTDRISKIIKTLQTIINNYNEYVNEFIKENDLILESISEKIAYICGLWNGLVDFVAGTLKFFGEILNLSNKSSEEREVIYESLDNFIELLQQPNLFDALQKSFNTFIEELKKQLLDKENQLDWVRIHYIAGFTLAFIGSLFIPIADLAALEKLGKIGKTIAEILESVGATVTKEVNALKEIVKNQANNLIKASQDVLSLITKGGNDFIDFIKNLAKKLADWFLKNKKTISLVEKVDDIIIPFIKILKQNTWYLNSLKLVEGPITNGKHGRQLGQWLAIESEAMVKLYTSFWYKTLNEALNKGKRLNKELKAMKEVLDNALLKLPVFNQNGKPLLRSVFHTEKEIAQLFKVHKEWISKGFFSTTHSEKSLFTWLGKNKHHNVIFKVYGKNGKLIEKAAYMPEECEVLFKSGTTFLVESVNKGARHPLDRNKKIVEIILKEK